MFILGSQPDGVAHASILPPTLRASILTDQVLAPTWSITASTPLFLVYLRTWAITSDLLLSMTRLAPSLFALLALFALEATVITLIPLALAKSMVAEPTPLFEPQINMVSPFLQFDLSNMFHAVK